MVKRKRKKRKRRNRKRKLRIRNDAAVAAFQHGGSGAHTDRKKEINKNSCREKIDQGEEDA